MNHPTPSESGADTGALRRAELGAIDYTAVYAAVRAERSRVIRGWIASFLSRRKAGSKAAANTDLQALDPLGVRV